MQQDVGEYFQRSSTQSKTLEILTGLLKISALTHCNPAFSLMVMVNTLLSPLKSKLFKLKLNYLTNLTFFIISKLQNLLDLSFKALRLLIDLIFSVFGCSFIAIKQKRVRQDFF